VVAEKSCPVAVFQKVHDPSEKVEDCDFDERGRTAQNQHGYKGPAHLTDEVKQKSDAAARHILWRR